MATTFEKWLELRGHTMNVHQETDQNPDNDPIQDTNVSTAVSHALLRARGAAIVSIGNLDPEYVVSLVAQEDWIILTTEDVLRSFHDDKQNSPSYHRTHKGVVLTGYSNSLSDEEEQWLQGVIRSNANSSRGRMTTLVLSSTLPRVDVFNHHFWWYNGPFNSSQAVFSVELQGQNALLKWYSLAGGGESLINREPRRWEKESSEVFR